jgi:hypothetical protein
MDDVLIAVIVDVSDDVCRRAMPMTRKALRLQRMSLGRKGWHLYCLLILDVNIRFRSYLAIPRVGMLRYSMRPARTSGTLPSHDVYPRRPDYARYN